MNNRNKQSTTSLLARLNQVSLKEIDTFIAGCEKKLSTEAYFSDFFASHEIKPSTIVKACQGYISKSYLYDLLGGKKNNPSRDNVLLICLGAHMNFKETRRTLELFHHRPLYPKETRDAIIAICINNEIFDIAVINDRLFEHGEKLFIAE